MAVPPGTDTTPRVSQLAGSIQRALRQVGSGWVEGEVQKLRRAGSGHVYFSLADADATIDCCVWRSWAGRIPEWPREGALVQAHFARVDFYAGSGRLSLHVDGLRLTGEGELLARRRATLERLRTDGLVARARRPLPRFPRRVGVIAARDSDAKADVVTALRARWPAVHVVHRAALVEGVRAVDSVIEALGHLQDVDGVDVIVVARGGGSVRDLVAFDDERLCRAVFACAVPVVTSIGHTAQRPNCDHVAAASADVPAKTAELVVPSAAEVAADLERHRAVIARVPAAVRSRAEELSAVWGRARAAHVLQRTAVELDRLGGRLAGTVTAFREERRRGLDDARHGLARGRWRMPAPAAVAALAVRLDHGRSRARRRAHDHGRAFDRLRGEAERTLTRRLRERDRDLAQGAHELAAAARRRLADADRSLRHAAELVAARDFRRSGWVLATDAAGRPVRSAAVLAPGVPLRLQLHDGTADATVTDVDQQEEPRHG